MPDDPAAERQPGWFRIYNTVMDDVVGQIGVYAFAVYALLLRHADRGGRCFPSHQRLADTLRISRPTVIRAIRTLVDAGLISVTPRGAAGEQTSHRYTVLPTAGGGSALQVQQPAASLAVNVVDTPCQSALQGCQAALQPPVNVVDTGRKPRLHEQDPVNNTQFNKEDRSPGRPAVPDPAPELELAAALAEVCQMSLGPNRGRLLREARQLSTATPPPTPALLHTHYGPGGWWWLNDWRGKQDEPPQPATIRETWGRWQAATSERSKGHGTTAKGRGAGHRILTGPRDAAYVVDNTPDRLAAAQAEWDRLAAEQRQPAPPG